MPRFCANCGTEVDETAAFCPTCGQPIDQAAETEIPEAPAWPEPPREERRSVPRASDGEVAAAPGPERDPVPEDPTRPHAPAAATPPAAAMHDEPPPADDGGEASGGVSLPMTWPVTLSGWLIGIGSVVAAIGVLVAMFRVVNVIDLLLLLLLAGIAATVFFSAQVPHIPHLRLATLAIVLVGFGIALDRIGFRVAGIGELLLFLGTAAATIGVLLLETGRDQPLGGSSA